MDTNTDNLWWDYTIMLEHFATVLLEAASKRRKYGHSTESDDVAQQMEDCAWEMLSVDDEFGSNQKHVDKFCEIMRYNILGWWD